MITKSYIIFNESYAVVKLRNILLNIDNLHLAHIFHSTDHLIQGHNAFSIYNSMKVGTTKVLWLNRYVIHKKLNFLNLF